MDLQQAYLEAQFYYVKDMMPAYANAVISNISHDGSILIDFGFIDPLLINELKKQPNQEQHGGEEPLPVRVKVNAFNRVILSQQTAEQLLQQIQNILIIIRESQGR